jgi:quinol monooxygenase YgiN
MTTKVVAELNFADGNTEKFVQMCRELFLETRCFNGYESIDISIDTDNENRLVMTEK